MIRKAQVSFEYLIVMGFVLFILSGILTISFFYGSEITDRLRMTQVVNYGNKIVSVVEAVYYAEEPSKATVEVYLPENVESVLVIGNFIVVRVATSTGENVITFGGDVPISGTFSSVSGIKKMEVVATSTGVVISPV